MTNAPDPDLATVGDLDAADATLAPAATIPPSSTSPTDPSLAQRVQAAARSWQQRLSTLGGANTLLWYQDLPGGTLELTTAHPGGLSMLMAGRPTWLSDLVREPSAFAEARRRAVIIADTAAQLADQRGLTTSFIGIGLATWAFGASPNPPSAPVLLRGVTLRPTDDRLEDFLLDLAPAVELNPVLVHCLRVEHGVRLDPDEVAALAHVDRRFDPGPVFRELNLLARGVPGFRITDRRILSTFPYAKLALVADLAEHADTLAEHPVVAALAGDDPHPVASTPVPALENDLDPARELLILDADAAQQSVVEALRAGGSLVIDAPPGTGVTQTVANTVAAATADGKSVLVLAQDRSELDDLTARLDSVGLADLVLPVREGAQHRQEILDALLSALDAPEPAPRTDLDRIRAALVTQRRTLAGHIDGLFSRQEPWGVSVFEVQTALAQLAARPVPPASRVRLSADVVRHLDRDAAHELARTMAELVDAGAWEHGRHARTDPWWGARISTQADAERARDLVAGLSGERLDTDRRQLDTALGSVGLPPANTPADYGRDLALLERVRQIRRRLEDEALRRPLEELLIATGDRAYRSSQPRRIGWWTRRSLRREARRLVREDIRIDDLHGTLQTVLDLRADWTDRAGVGTFPALPADYEQACATWADLERDLGWLAGVLAATGTPGPFLDTAFADLRQQLARLAARAERVAVLPEVLPVLDELEARGLRGVVDELAARGISPQQCEDEIGLIWWASVLDELATQEDTYGQHDGRALRDVVAEYVRLDDAHIRSGADQVARAVYERRRTAIAAHPQQLAFLRATMSSGRPAPWSGQVLREAPDVALAARPVWLASPLVVASVLPPQVSFDLVIVIDAGRLEVPEALGAVLRGRAVAAFGDTRRLGPAPFAVANTPPPAARPGRERTPLSLAAALTRVLPGAALRWHHRGVDERLVSFANRQWYDGALTTVPGCARTSPVQILDAPVDEFLERVVQEIQQHPQRHPGQSFGVLATDQAAADRIRDALRQARAQETQSVVSQSAASQTAAPQPADFTIRDPWGFQGITRDRVLVVLGPTGADGGALDTMPSQAALTVALTCARQRLTLMLPSEYRGQAPSRWDSPADAAVREFVAHAQAAGTKPSGSSEVEPAVDTSDALLTELAQRLAHEGLQVHQGYGAGAHPLDIAVEDPHRPGALLVAVDSDGRRARELPTVRERERLWPQHLQRAGWEYVRVWSTDVFRDPVRDVARVSEAVRAAQTRTSWSGRS